MLAAEVIGPDDVGMVELYRQLRFVDEHADEVRVGGVLRMNDLDGNALPGASVSRGGEVDLRHAPNCNLSEQRIGA